jgi:hypothetical protein
MTQKVQSELIDIALASQAEMEAGTETGLRLMSPLRVKQAITAGAPPSGVTSLNGQTGDITNTDYGAIGSYVIAALDTFGLIDRLPNVTVAGSTLIRSTQTAQHGINLVSGVIVGNTAYVSLGFSGTWRRMTRSIGGTAGSSGGDLYVRIS